MSIAISRSRPGFLLSSLYHIYLEPSQQSSIVRTRIRNVIRIANRALRQLKLNLIRLLYVRIEFFQVSILLVGTSWIGAYLGYDQDHGI